MASPVIYYTFETGDGTNSGTTGSTHDLTIPNDFSIDTSGKRIGNKGLLAGPVDNVSRSGSTGSYYTSLSNNWSTSQTFTIALWVKPSGNFLSTDQRIVSFSLDNAATNTALCYNNSTKLTIWGNGVNNYIDVPNQFDDMWHHYVFIFNETEIIVYVDNLLQGTVTGYPTYSNRSMVLLALGADSGGGNPGNAKILNGYIDDFRIYDYALTASQIQSVIHLNDLPLIHYTFDTDGTNSGLLGNSFDVTVPSQFSIDTSNQFSGAGCLKAIRTDGNTLTTDANALTDIDNIPVYGNGYTISMWAKIASYETPHQTLFDFKMTGQNKNIIHYASATDVRLFGPTGAGGINEPLPNTVTPFDNNYHHHLYVVNSNGDGTSNASYYIDNTLILTYNSATYLGIINNVNSIYDLHIGGSQWTTVATANGYIDDFRVYDYGLSTSQIRILYVSGLIHQGTSTADLLAEGFTIAELLAAGLSVAELLAGGAIPDWTFVTDANHFAQSYVKDFIDISGSLVLRENSSLTVNGNIETKGNITIKNPTMAADLSLNHNMLVGGDISMNGNVTVGDISMNGKVVDCSFTDSSIPESAFNGQIGPDYTQPTILYDKGFDTTADVSMNANVQINNLKVDGNIEFSDGTTMNTYDDNKGVSYGAQFLESNLTITHSTSYEVGATPMRCSADGKYSIVHYGNVSVTGNTNYTGNTATKSAILLSSDYGETYNAITLPTMPVISSTYNAVTSITGDNDFTKVDFKCMGISPSGKNIIIGISGTEQVVNNWTNTSVAWSLDHGSTWETHYIKEILGAAVTGQQPSWVLFPTACAIDDAGKVAIATDKSNQYTQSPAKGIFYSVDRTSGSFMYSSAYPGRNYGLDITNNEIAFATQGVFYKLTFTGVLRSVSMPNINNSYYKYSVSQYVGNDGLCAIFTLGWQSTTTATSPCYFIKDDGTTLTVIDKSTTIAGVFTDTVKYHRLANVMSASGKYILIGAADGFADTAENVNIREVGYQVYYSEDYGATFTMNTFELQPLMPTTVARNIVITDNGYIYAKYGNRDTSKFKFLSLFKASTFTSLTINNTLTAGSFSTSSDYRIKTDISQLDETVTLDNLRPVKYLQTLINKPQYGLIAHELQEYYPDLVVGEKDGNEWQRVNYTGLIALLINEIKQLKRELTELENGM